jgi:hypothetical protein
MDRILSILKKIFGQAYLLLIIIAVSAFSAYIIYFAYKNMYDMYRMENESAVIVKNPVNLVDYQTAVEKKADKQSPNYFNQIKDPFARPNP